MSSVMEFYQQQAEQAQSSVPWLAQLQHNALQDFVRLGFPLRQNEEWKYTLMEDFLKQRFTLGNPPQSVAKPRISDLPYTQQLELHNGRLAEAKWLQQLPAGVIIMPLLKAIDQHPQLIKAYLSQLLPHHHAFQALNSAMFNSGLVIYLPRGVHLEEPIVINHWQDEAHQAIYTRQLIIAEAGAQATIVDHYQGGENVNYLTDSMSEIFLGEQAVITHYHIQRESVAAYHISHVMVQQQEGSRFDSHTLSVGGKLARSDTSINFHQPHARCLLNGIYMPDGNQHIDHHTLIHHHVGSCVSEQDYRGVMQSHARAVFNGKVIVAKDAQHTEANQQNKNLLLSAQAEIDTKPQLEIFADDVICTHGATVGQLDEEALFYLATRGIDREEAASYLIHAFTADNIQRIADRQLREWVIALINQKLR